MQQLFWLVNLILERRQLLGCANLFLIEVFKLSYFVNLIQPLFQSLYVVAHFRDNLFLLKQADLHFF